MTVTDRDKDAVLTRNADVGATSLGLLVLRLFVGLALAAHGAQKLFGLFGGAGIDGTGNSFEALGFEPGVPFALVSGLTEFGGGLLIALGLALPLAAGAVVANMVGAYATVQASADGDFFFSSGGPELELFYVCAAFALILTGPGRLALRVPALDNPRMRLLGVAMAVVGGIVAVVVFHL